MGIEPLARRLDRMIDKLEQQAARVAHYAVIIYNPLTRQPLPGYEPATIGNVWIPDNGRDRV